MRLTKEIKNISVDAEWYKNEFLTVQMAASNEKGEIVDYYIFSKEHSTLERCPKVYNGVPVTVVRHPIGKEGILNTFEELPVELECLFFYSPRDIEGLLGQDIWRELLLNGEVSKTRNLNIRSQRLDYEQSSKCRLMFKDLFGRFGCSLEDAYRFLYI